MNFQSRSTREAAAHDLKAMARIMDDLKLTWWVEAGTFLGAVRHGGFIPHDRDIDIGVLGDASAPDIRHAAIGAGFNILADRGHDGHWRELTFSKSGAKVDVFFFYPTEPGKIAMGCWHRGKAIVLEFDDALILKGGQAGHALVEGVRVRAPVDAHGYLAARYGPNWRTPDPKWRWHLDPLCIRWDKSEVSREEIIADEKRR